MRTRFPEKRTGSLLAFVLSVMVMGGAAYLLAEEREFLAGRDLISRTWLTAGAGLAVAGLSFWSFFIRDRWDVIYTATGFRIVNRSDPEFEDVYHMANLKKFEFVTRGDRIKSVIMRFRDGRKVKIKPSRYRDGETLLKKIREHLV